MYLKNSYKLFMRTKLNVWVKDISHMQDTSFVVCLLTPIIIHCVKEVRGQIKPV